MRILFSVIGVCISFVVVLVTIFTTSVGALMFMTGPDTFLRDMERGEAAVPLVFTFAVALLLFLTFFRLVAGMYRTHVARVIEPEKVHADASETRMIQEIHQGLMNFERRIEALETLLLDRERAGKF
ncbi:MAG: hypothetical protein AMXMBFR84_32070 [Candidatus Hydrogenedentota bacterium]